MVPHWIDTVLDRSVVVGYTKLGYNIRSRWWAPQDSGALRDRVVALTGATSGIGRAVAELLAHQGAHLLLLVRDRERGTAVRAELTASAPGARIDLYSCDLASMASVRACAAALTAEGEPLDVLVNNAGVLTPDRQLSADGFELTFATNVLGPFLLTSLLARSLSQGGPGTVITVSSAGMYTQRLHADDLEMERERFSGSVAYARCKRAQVILNELWAGHLATDGVSCHAMHPGWVDTPGLATSLPRFRGALRPLLRTPEQGADTIAWLAATQGLGSGGFWHDRRQRPTHLLPRTRESDEDRARLWRECRARTGAPER